LNAQENSFEVNKQTKADLLKARTRHLEEEQRREQTLRLPFPSPSRTESAKADS
jgi:hypothetical protein